MTSIVVVVADASEEAARRAFGRLLGSHAQFPELVVEQGVAIGAEGPGMSARTGAGLPLATSACGSTNLALDGRLTNRADLLAALGMASSPPSSDAELFLLAYEHWGEAALERVDGSFAVAIVDGKDRSVLLARDAIGDKTLFYWSDGGRLVAASEEVAVLSYPAVGGEPDHRRLAAHFGTAIPESGATFFRHVREVPPAHAVRFRNGRLSLSKFWEPAPLAGPKPRSDDEWAELFVDCLDRAVARCLPASGRSAVLLSGGLDSCPIAALAAPRVAPGRLAAISWVFDELRSCDERSYIDEVAGALDLESISIPSDDLFPLSERDSWPTDLNRPEHDPYRRLIARGNQVAREAGFTTMLSGFGGDHLYVGAGGWFLALLAEGRPRDALAGLRAAVREVGLYRAIRTLVVSPLVPRWLRRKRAPRPWLTPYARQLLGSSDAPAIAPPGRPRRRQILLSETTAFYAAKEVRYASRAGVDLRYPFRDRALIELALALPSHQLERGWTTRPIVRRGFSRLLPDAVVQRPRKTSLRPLSDRGMFGPGRPSLEELLAGNDHLWAEFVEPRWVAEAIRNRDMPESEAITIWYCAFVDLWSKRMLECS